MEVTSTEKKTYIKLQPEGFVTSESYKNREKTDIYILPLVPKKLIILNNEENTQKKIPT